MPTSPCACGSSSSRNCTAPASPRSMKRWNARWSRCWPKWRWQASRSTATRCRACPTPSRRNWSQLEEEIHDIAGEKFNVGSPKQLGEILFDRLQIPGGTTGKTGAYATGADILEDITTMEDSHPQGAQLAARVLDWRQIAKLKSTYTDALQAGDQPRYRPRPHLLFHRGRQHRAAGLHRPEPAKHPRAHRRRPPHPRGLRRAAGPRSGLPRLLPDRTAHPGPHRRHPRTATGLPRRPRHPRPDRVRDVQRAPWTR